MKSPIATTATEKNASLLDVASRNEDDACFIDMDYFIKTLSTATTQGVRPDIIGSIISHYSSKWLPELSMDEANPQSCTVSTSSWTNKRFFVERLVTTLPHDRDSVSCDFLLRLLRTANMVGAVQLIRDELEQRISWQLDQASVSSLIIPTNYTSGTGILWDVELVLRLVRMFVALDEARKTVKDALAKVAELVDNYLAEVAVDDNFKVSEFIGLGGALPSHARASDDGLYRAIDAYLTAHPSTSKQEKKALCRLLNGEKLSQEASIHVVLNKRLPVRSIIQVFLNHNFKSKLTYSPSTTCYFSKNEIMTQETEITSLSNQVSALWSQCHTIQAHIERLMNNKKSKEKKKKSSSFKWWKLGKPLLLPSPLQVERTEKKFEKMLR